MRFDNQDIYRLWLTDNNMQKRKISLSKQCSSGQGSPHPKRENPQINKHKREVLADKQHAQQFMQSIININHLLQGTFSFNKQQKRQKQEQLPLASHLSGYYEGRKTLLLHTQSHKMETVHKKNHKYETTTKTQHTYIDQESEYQNYLKQYQTLVKNSRSKEFVSPMAHKKQIDQLITEFLSDMQDSDVKSSEISPKNSKNIIHQKLQKHERQEKSRSPTPEIVKIQKIDLSQLKANSYHNSYSKSNKKDLLKQEKQTPKRKENTKAMKTRENYVKIQTISPRFIDGEKGQKSRFERRQIINKTKNLQTKHDELKIQVINVEDLRKRKNVDGERQVQEASKVQNSGIKQKTYERVQSQKNSYLKQNFYKISKTEQKKSISSQPKIQTKQTIQKNESQNMGKKPLKIQIQISQQFEDDQSKNEELPELEQQKTQIIRLISKKVTNMIHDTQKIAFSKGK